MKSIFTIVLFLLSARAFAQGQISTSKFQFFQNKCEPSAEEGLDASPQSPPLDVDDPGTPGCNRWEINVTTDGDFTKGEHHLELPLLDINYGIGDNMQLKYEIPMEKNQADGVTESAVGASKAGIKYMFFSDEESDTEMSFYPQYSSDKIVSLPFLFSTKILGTEKGDLKMSANVGYNVSSQQGTEDSVFLAAGLGFPVFKRVALMGELSAEEAIRKNEDGVRDELVKANIGAIGSLSKKFSIYASFGESLASSDHQNHLYALTGVRFATESF